MNVRVTAVVTRLVSGIVPVTSNTPARPTVEPTVLSPHKTVPPSVVCVCQVQSVTRVPISTPAIRTVEVKPPPVAMVDRGAIAPVTRAGGRLLTVINTVPATAAARTSIQLGMVLRTDTTVTTVR